MTILILEKVPESLRGELTRWMLEVKAGVFVGTMTATVREKLWDKTIESLRTHSGALLIHSHPDSEWGFHLRHHGSLSRRIVERDGLQLIERDHPDRDKALRKLAASIPASLRRELLQKVKGATSATCPPPSLPESKSVETHNGDSER